MQLTTAAQQQQWNGQGNEIMANHIHVNVVNNCVCFGGRNVCFLAVANQSHNLDSKPKGIGSLVKTIESKHWTRPSLILCSDNEWNWNCFPIYQNVIKLMFRRWRMPFRKWVCQTIAALVCHRNQWHSSAHSQCKCMTPATRAKPHWNSSIAGRFSSVNHRQMYSIDFLQELFVGSAPIQIFG